MRTLYAPKPLTGIARVESQLLGTLLSAGGSLFWILGAMLSWWVRTIWGMVKAQQKQISDLQVEVAKDYVSKDELRDTLNRIFDTLDDIRKEMRK